MTVPTPHERQATLETIAFQYHLQTQTLQTTLFSLYSLRDTRQCENKEMRVYVEGDGLAWKTRSQLSDNPTPINPLSAKLMSIDSSQCKVYLARPCQYTNDTQCDEKYWSSHRFSPEVIQSYVEALDQLKKTYDIDSFTLIGYSGGGAVATLSAAARSDVKELISVAGNLDTEKWVQIHAISPLEGSFNPAIFASKLEHIPQMHYIGKEDTIVPKEVFFSYLNHFKNTDMIHYRLIEDATHTQGWEKVWQENR